MIYNIKDIDEDKLCILYATVYDTTFLHRKDLSSLTGLFNEILVLDTKLVKYADEIKCILSMSSLSFMEGYRGFILPFHTKYYTASNKTVKYKLNSKRMRDLVYTLEENGYIDFYLGYWSSPTDSKRNIIIMKDKIISHLDTSSHKFQGLRETDEDSCVVEIVDTSKSTKIKVYDFNSNRTVTVKDLVFKNNKGITGVKGIKSDLLRYNKFMKLQNITLDGVNIPLNYKRRFHDDLTRCGRYISPSHSIKSVDRERLMINDKETVELDYQACHPRMIAQIENYQLGDDFDPYMVPELLEAGMNRDDIKQFLYPILYTKAERYAKSSISLILKCYPTVDLTVDQVIEAFLRYNPYMEKYKFRESFYENLQNVESIMCTRVMNNCLDERIPVLSIHDSFVTNAEYEEDVLENMYEAWFCCAAQANLKVNNCKIRSKS